MLWHIAEKFGFLVWHIAIKFWSSTSFPILVFNGFCLGLSVVCSLGIYGGYQIVISDILVWIRWRVSAERGAVLPSAPWINNINIQFNNTSRIPDETSWRLLMTPSGTMMRRLSWFLYQPDNKKYIWSTHDGLFTFVCFWPTNFIQCLASCLSFLLLCASCFFLAKPFLTLLALVLMGS